MMAPGETEGIAENREQLAPYVDEVCFFDTSNVVPFHFAQARNASLDRASTDYVFVLDDDERVAEPALMQGLRASLRKGVAVLRCQVINFVPGAEPHVGWSERVFLNTPALRYQGAVHHTMPWADYCARNKAQHLRSSLTILHHGYDLPLSERRAKYLPRLALYDQMLSEYAPGSPGYGYYLYKKGECFYMAGEWGQAIDPLVESLLYIKDQAGRRAAIYLAKAFGEAANRGRVRLSFAARDQLKTIARRLARYGDEEALRHAAGMLDIAGKTVEAKRLMRTL